MVEVISVGGEDALVILDDLVAFPPVFSKLALQGGDLLGLNINFFVLRTM